MEIRNARIEKKLNDSIGVINKCVKLSEEDKVTVRTTCKRYINLAQDHLLMVNESYKLITIGALYYLKTSGKLKNDQFKMIDLIKVFGKSSGSK